MRKHLLAVRNLICVQSAVRGPQDARSYAPDRVQGVRPIPLALRAETLETQGVITIRVRGAPKLELRFPVLAPLAQPPFALAVLERVLRHPFPPAARRIEGRQDSS